MTKDRYYLDARVAAAYDREGVSSQGDDVPFYVALARDAAADGLPMLELACGTGRVTLPIAEAGARVVGLDRSPAMLDVARRKSEGRADLDARWVEGDMADFELDERFGLVIIPCRSFLLLQTVEEQRACLERVREHLVPGGRLALNFFNPDLQLIDAWQTSKKGQWETRKAADGSEFQSTRSYDSAEQRMEETRVKEEPGGDGVVKSKVYRGLKLRYVSRDEMERLLLTAGFEVEALYGGFDRRPFETSSPEQVWLARRPD